MAFHGASPEYKYYHGSDGRLYPSRQGNLPSGQLCGAHMPYQTHFRTTQEQGPLWNNPNTYPCGVCNELGYVTNMGNRQRLVIRSGCTRHISAASTGGLPHFSGGQSTSGESQPLRNEGVQRRRSSDSVACAARTSYFCHEPGCRGRKHFSRKTDLERHRKTHRQEKPWHCGCCKNANTAYRTTRKDHLVQHLRKKHRAMIKPCWCPVIGYDGAASWLAFSSMLCLDEHMQQHHTSSSIGDAEEVRNKVLQPGFNNSESPTCDCKWQNPHPEQVPEMSPRNDGRPRLDQYSTAVNSFRQAPPLSTRTMSWTENVESIMELEQCFNIGSDNDTQCLADTMWQHS